MSGAVEFFEIQITRQVASHELALNSFEEMSLPYIRGRVLGPGCGLGYFALESGRRGCDVLAVDACPTAIERINRDAAVRLRGGAVAADISAFPIEGNYDTEVSIGLLMKWPFACRTMSEPRSMRMAVQS